MTRLQIHQLDSGYRGQAVIHNINLQIESGQIAGLIGLNGAGKSTLLKTILGLIKPIKGELHLDGYSVLEDQAAYASKIAYVPETPILYEELTLKEHLEMTALGYGIPFEVVMERAQPLLELFRLDKHLNWLPIHFSKGMKQKVMIICAFVIDADLLIIDEPFLGLDPLAINHLTRLMKEAAAAGKAIIFTTHVLAIADQLCDQFLFLQQGRLVGSGSLSQVQDQMGLPGADLETLYLKMTEGQI
ncbi:TPA: ABC transporter ATP-binding protein [Streptococcus suis]